MLFQWSLHGAGTAASVAIDAGLITWDVAEDIMDTTETEDGGQAEDTSQE